MEINTMNSVFTCVNMYPVMDLRRNYPKTSCIMAMAKFNGRRIHHVRKIPKNLRYPRRTKLPPEFGVNLFLKKPASNTNPCEEEEEESGEEEVENDEIVWEPDEIEAISSLFQGRVPQKPGNLYKTKPRPLPLPLPHKLRPLGLPTPKKHVKTVSPMVAASRASLTKQMYKNPTFLTGLAKQIKCLSPDEDASMVLNKWGRFLRKGSLSITIRELGHMNLPKRAFQTCLWAQEQPHLHPDDRVLASTVEVLARNHEFKMLNLEDYTSLTSRVVIEATVKGFIKGGSLNLAWKLLMVARDGKRMLDPSVYAKLILELGKNPDKHMLVMTLLDHLKERESLNLTQQDCTSIMKVCIKLGKFDVVESLYSWFLQSGNEPTVVMCTTVIHSRYSEKRYREAAAIVWKMEESNFLFDLPAYRVIIKLFVTLNDLSGAFRYFSKLKEAGFCPTYDIYRDLIDIYMVFGRVAKCKEVRKEAEAAGFKLDKHTLSKLLQLEQVSRIMHMEPHYSVVLVYRYFTTRVYCGIYTRGGLITSFVGLRHLKEPIR